jgi:cellulose synthase/poly-beta-1,6-N-acetylglucosamine synthase-like glycosyltransferase
MSSVVVGILVAISLITFVFFVVYSIATLALTGYSLVEEVQQKIERGDLFHPLRRPLRSGISLVVPAYNEELVIVPAVRSLLGVDYEPLEVVVSDDGSTDGTLAALTEAFDLRELPLGDRFDIETEPLEQHYVSATDPRLRVGVKRNGGRSDAINAGINLARHDLVGIVDADSLLDRDALARIVEVFAADPDRVIAVGGTVRVANGGVIEDGVMTRPRVPVRGLEASQVTEYLRSFLAARIAWSSMNGLLIISGAFGVFRRDLFRAVGGLSRETLGEDMEMVMRLHERLRPVRPGVRIEFAADATCWTEAPSGLRPLRGQRIRWHIGLLDNLRLHRGMIGRKRYGAVGLLSLPYTILVEVFGPILQVIGYATVIVLAIYDLIAWEYAIVFLLLVLLVAQLQTAGAILAEEIGFGRYRRRDLLLIGGWGLLEMFWYQPMSAFWRIWATFLWVIGRRPGWGTIPRGAALAARPPAEAPELAPAPLSR